jgi:hypothetical protein
MPEYEQNAAEIIFNPGIYNFECVDAREKETKASDPMIELHLDVFSADCTQKISVIDRLVFKPGYGFKKIDEFRKATGDKVVKNERVIFDAEDCFARIGKVKLKTTTYKGRVRNEVDSYIESKDEQPAEPIEPEETPADLKQRFKAEVAAAANRQSNNQSNPF